MKKRDVFTVQEVAARLGIGRATAYEAARCGEIPVIRIGRRLLVPCAAFYKMLATAGKDRDDLGDGKDQNTT